MGRYLAALGLSTALAGAAAMPTGVEAAAAVGFGGQGGGALQGRIAPIDEVQFFWGGRNYCWYPLGWRGPGWYWCGYAGRPGLGWGGPDGWRGWRGRPGDRGHGPSGRGPRGPVVHPPVMGHPPGAGHPPKKP